MHYFRATVKHIPIASLILLFTVVSGYASDALLDGDGSNHLKYPYKRVPLAAALNGQIGDYNGRFGVGVNGVKRVTGRDSGTTSKSLHDAPLNGVGEVFVPKTFAHSSQEPSCEQLRAMWIFSKRQSRAAEITNEIPTYRDPFTYNVWEPLYSSTRSLGSVRMSPRERSRSPVFGRIISREPQRPIGLQGQRQRHFGPSVFSVGDTNSGFLFGGETRPFNLAGSSIRRPSQSRYIAGANGSSSNLVGSANQNSVPVQGSFEKLKELIWTERAKELTQQRRAEEIAARAAVLKEIASGQIVKSSYKPKNFKSDSPLMEENRSPDNEGNQYINDGRISIAKGQMHTTGNENPHSNSLGRASSRTFSNRFAQQGNFVRNIANQKGSIFSENKSSVQTGPSSRIRIPSNGSPPTDGRDFNADITNPVGTPRSYPLRQSHFRERNRSLFKQYAPYDNFQRELRGWPFKKSTDSSPYRKQIFPNSNQHLLEQYNLEIDPSEMINRQSELHSKEIYGDDGDDNVNSDDEWIYSDNAQNEKFVEKIRSDHDLYDYNMN